jgi:3-oxoacyl-[acyl-carrier-protein] synthase-3
MQQVRTTIVGTGLYAPKKVMDNHALEKLVETSDQWIVERTGIRERRVAADDETASDLALKASLQALEMAKIRPEDVEMIILGTVSGDMPFPSTAAVLQGKMGNKKGFAVDVSAACAGSLYAMALADKYIAGGGVKNALVVGTEVLTRIVDWKDRNTCILFGDGAGAMVLAPSPEKDRGILSTHLHSDGTLWNILHIPGGGTTHPFSEKVLQDRSHYVRMSGKEVFKVAIRALEEVAREALAAHKLSAGDISHVVAHQANVRILSGVLDRLGIPMSKCHVNLDKYGNTSAASLPMTLDEVNRMGRIKKGEMVLMLAIGGGMAWGSALVRW